MIILFMNLLREKISDNRQKIFITFLVNDGFLC